jgi:small subunit ribosomal protein S18
MNEIKKQPLDIESLTYKDKIALGEFTSEQGKILPRRITGLNSKQQKRITRLVKRARVAGFLPFVVGKN